MIGPQLGRWIELAGIEPRSRWPPRLAAFTGLVILLSTVLTWRLADLEIVQGHTFAAQALVNRVHRIPVLAERGVIYDRHGRQLVVNQPAWSLAVTTIALPANRSRRSAELTRLGDLAGLSAPALAARLAEDLDPYRPFAIKTGLTDAQAQAVKERLPQLPGASLQQVAIRRYVDAELFGHLLGYVGPIDPDEFAQLKLKGYLPDEMVGKAGLEAGLEPLLRGTDGWQDVETDANGQVVRVLRAQPAIPGRSVQLSIDADLQKGVHDALVEGLAKAGSKAGASVVADPHTGEILAMVSVPGYDDNLFARGISQADYDRLLKDPGKPLYDRALAGEYPPGSTFKMITGTAGLQEGKITPATQLPCPSHLSYGAWTYWNWAHYDMGSMNVGRAIPTSCDTFFYEVASRLGPGTLAGYARAWGYGAKPGIELPGARAGVAPTADYKLQVCPYPTGTPDCKWNVGDTVTYGIGQSYVLTTPLIQAMYVAALANGGTLLRPTLIHQVADGAGKVLSLTHPDVVRQVPIDAANIEVLRAGMHDSLTGSWGTAAIARSLGYRYDGGGKTGTAQFGGSGADLPSHAWFIQFAPYDNPEYASATILEGAGFGEFVAEPVAIRYANYYFTHRDQIRAG
ncbi:MAG: penicillin-binding protein 2 [Candidatus Dormibacteraceae bacterium]